jgi:hypothetical protein
MLIWYPDFCARGQCVLEIEQGHTGLVFAISFCPHHQSLKDGGLTDAQVFAAIVQSSRVKEAARWAAKLHLLLDKEHPGVPYRVETDGNFTIGVDSRGEEMPEWPKNDIQRALLATAIDAAVLEVTRPAGTSTFRLSGDTVVRRA